MERLKVASPLTVVRAPMGSGKTSLLAEFLTTLEESEGGTAVLVTADIMKVLESGDAWGYIASNLTQPNPAPNGSDVPANGSESAGSTEELPKSPKEQIFTYLSKNTQPLYLIFDDGAFLSRTDAEFILLLLRTFRHVSVVVATQAHTALETSRMRMSCDITVVGTDDLNFTPAEVADYLRAHVSHISDSLIATVVTRGYGNAAMTRTALQYLLDNGVSDKEAAVDDLIEHLQSVGRVNIDDLLADKEFAKFLYQTSIVDSVSQGLARDIVGTRDTAELLSRAEAEGLGSWHSSPAIFTFSPLVLNELRNRREDALGERALTAAVHAAVDYQERVGQPGGALLTALKNRDFALANEIVLRNSDSLLGTSKPSLAPILQWIPDSVSDHHPELGLLAAMGLLARPENRSRAVDMLHRTGMTAGRLRDRSDALRDAMLLATEGIAARKNGRPTRALESALRSSALVQLAQENASQAPIAGMDFTIVSNAATMITAGAYEEASQSLLSITEGGTSTTMCIFANAHLAAAAALAGDMVLADRAAQAVAFGPGFAEDGSLLADAAAFMMEIYNAVHALEVFDLERASVILFRLEGMPQATEYWAVLAQVQAMRDLLAGDAFEGISRLRATRNRFSTEGLTQRSQDALDYMNQILRAASGQTLSLEEHQDSFNSRNASAVHMLSYARILFHAGKLVPALNVLNKIQARKDTTARVGVEALVLESAILVRYEGRVDLALSLGNLISHLREYGTRVPLALLSESDISALIEADKEIGNGELADLVAEVRVRALELEVVTPLTTRERQILNRLATKETLIEIGESLFISENTVRTHVKSIYKKLGASKRQEALIVAGVRGLLEEI